MPPNNNDSTGRVASLDASPSVSSIQASISQDASLQDSSEQESSLANNRFLLAYRGHGRQWKDSQLTDVLVYLGQGYSFAKSCELAGIPRRSAYRTMDLEPAFAEAVTHVKNNDGADWYRDANRGIIEGTVNPKATGAIVVAMKDRGYLLDKAPTVIVDQRQLTLPSGPLDIQRTRAQGNQ